MYPTRSPRISTQLDQNRIRSDSILNHVHKIDPIMVTIYNVIMSWAEFVKVGYESN